MDVKSKAVVLRNYFDRYTQVTAMLTGFQSFVLTMDTLEKVDYIPTYLVSVSFLGNMFVCFISIISYNSITGGLYLELFDKINVLCIVLLAASNACYFTSVMWSSHITFVESSLVDHNAFSYSQLFLYSATVILGLFTTVYNVVCECKKSRLSCSDRTELINHLH